MSVCYLQHATDVIFYTEFSTGMSDCDDGDVRLVGGSNSTLGRVEVCVNKAWGTVCNRRFGTNDASVICHQLGFSTEGSMTRTCYHDILYCSVVCL